MPVAWKKVPLPYTSSTIIFISNIPENFIFEKVLAIAWSTPYMSSLVRDSISSSSTSITVLRLLNLRSQRLLLLPSFCFFQWYSTQSHTNIPCLAIYPTMLGSSFPNYVSLTQLFTLSFSQTLPSSVTALMIAYEACCFLINPSAYKMMKFYYIHIFIKHTYAFLELHTNDDICIRVFVYIGWLMIYQ